MTQGVVVTASVNEVDRDNILTRDMYETDYECDFGYAVKATNIEE